MKTILFALSFILLTTFITETKAIATTQATVEEQVVMKHFTNYQGALVYNEVCNGASPKDRYNLDKTINVILMGNEQMLAARAGGLQRIRFPDANVDELVKKLVTASKHIQTGIRKILEETGCENPNSESLKKAYLLFTTVHSSQIYAFIDKEIVEKGGTVTSLEEIEAGEKSLLKDNN